MRRSLILLLGTSILFEAVQALAQEATLTARVQQSTAGNKSASFQGSQGGGMVDSASIPRRRSGHSLRLFEAYTTPQKF